MKQVFYAIKQHRIPTMKESTANFEEYPRSTEVYDSMQHFYKVLEANLTFTNE